MQLSRPAPALDKAGIGRALAHLEAYIKSQGLKSSSIRNVVARAALRRRGHFSVDELVSDLQAGGASDVHLATVYRVLPLLVDAGLLRLTEVSSSDGARYERAFERTHHDHLICTVCGAVVEFELDAIEVLQRDLATKLDFEITSHVHELLGTCARCRKVAS
jgi:Fur family transcriptional regulator, ferric uptake regulator